jgi:hypothetical protein
LYEQTAIERRSAELGRLAEARTVYRVYQSHNALFNAIHVFGEHDQALSERLRTFQFYNYELGLAAIEDALPVDEKDDIPPMHNAYASGEQVEAQMETIQKRLSLLQTRLAARESVIAKAAAAAKHRHLIAYFALSTLAVLGAIGKTIETLVGA